MAHKIVQKWVDYSIIINCNGEKQSWPFITLNDPESNNINPSIV